MMGEGDPMTTRILFATDGLPPARAAGLLLRRLVVPDRVEVSILTAVDDLRADTSNGGAQTILDEEQQDMVDAGIVCETRTDQGEPAAVIDRALDGEDFGLVVVGAGKHPWLQRFVFGTVTTHLLNVVAVPLLVVHRGGADTTAPVRTVVGVDGSASADHALDSLISLTSPERASIEVRSIVEMPVIPMTGLGHAPAFTSSRDVQRVIDHRRNAAEARVKSAAERLRDAGFEAAHTVVDGAAAIDLVDHATRVGADLVSVGARGLGPIGRLTVGSVSAHVARNAPATLVVRLPHGFDEG